MGKRGPKPSVTHEERVEELKKHEIFDHNGKLKRESDPFWSVVCSNLMKNKNNCAKINPRNIYTYVAQNRNNILRDLKAEKVLNNHQDGVQEYNKEKLFDMEKLLLEIQDNVLYKPIVREFSSYPFSIFHWPSDAIDLVSDLALSTKFIFAQIGNFCQEFLAPDGSSSNKINLFALGIEIAGEFVPICQLSSEENAKSIIKRFLMDCIRSGLQIPYRLMLDYNKHHYLAAVSAFNVTLTYEQYLLMCFRTLFRKKDDCILPRCIINTNERLLVLKVRKWQCITNIRLESVKLFYVYCVILLSIQTNVEEFEVILEKTFFLFYSEFQSQQTHDHFEWLLSKINSSKINEIYSKANIARISDKYENSINSEEPRVDYSKCQEILEYIMLIFAKAKQCISLDYSEKSSDKNIYYNEEFCKLLIKLCAEFTVWTRIMLKNDGDNVEEKFTELIIGYEENFRSQFIIEDGKTVSVNEYLLKNIDYVDSLLQKARKNQRFLNNHSLSADKNDITENTFIYHEENWMGLNEIDSYSDEEVKDDSESDKSTETSFDRIDDIDDLGTGFEKTTLEAVIDSVCLEDSHQDSITKSEASVAQSLCIEKDVNEINDEITDVKVKKQRGKFLRACPEIDLLSQKPTKKPKKRKLIRNSNLLKSKSVDKNKKKIVTSSPMDSILEILTSAYFMSQKFQDSINDTMDILNEYQQTMLNILLDYTENFNVTKLYAARTKLFYNVCNQQEYTICWTKSVGEFFEKVIYSTILKKYCCKTCSNVMYNHQNIIKLPCENLLSQDLSEYVHAQLKDNQMCSKCTNSTEAEFYIKDILCIDVENQTTEVDENSINLNDLPQTLKIGEQTVLLIGVIGFEKPIDNKI